MLTSLLDELLADDRARLLDLGSLQEVPAGHEITRQGTIGNCLFVVESGELDVVRRVPGDEEEVLDTAPAGTLVGELAVLDRRPRSASLRARRPTVVRVIDLRCFESLTLDGGACGRRILQAVAVSLHHRLAAARAGVAARFEGASPATRAARAPAVPPSWSAPADGTARLLDALPVFAALGPAETRRLAAMMETASIPRGIELQLPAGAEPAATVLLRGALSPCLAVNGGCAVALPVVAPGGFVDYAAVIERQHTRSFWRARSPTIIARLPAAAFAAGATSGSRLMYALCRDLAITLRSTTGLAMHLGMQWDHAAGAAFGMATA